MSHKQTSSLVRRIGQLYYGWWIVAANSAIILTGGFHFHGTTVFFLPMAENLGLSRGSLSLIFAASRLEGGVEGPIVGWLVDRLGARLVILGGAILLGLGYIALATVVNDFWSLFFVYILLISTGIGAATWAPVMAAVNRWFIRRRTIAMSVLSIFNRVGAFLLVPLLSLTVLHLGWRTGALIAGVTMMGIMMAMSLINRPSPEGMGLRPDGEQSTPTGASPNPVAVRAAPPHAPRGHDFTLREALKTSAFWMLVLGHMMRFMVGGAISLHLIPILVWKGLDRQGAANLIGIMWVTSILAVLILGWAGDRFTKRNVVAFTFLLGATGLALILFTTHTGLLLMALVLYVVTDASASVIGSMVGDYFGRQNFATIRGLFSFFGSPAGFASTFLTGWAYDRTDSYALALIGLTIAAAAATPLFLAARPPKPPPDAVPAISGPAALHRKPPGQGI